MNIDIKIVLFTILELILLLLVKFIGVNAITLSLIMVIIEIQLIELYELTDRKINNKI